MIYFAVMLFATLGIYVWMTVTLPGSTQEVGLNDVADALVQEHNAERPLGALERGPAPGPGGVQALKVEQGVGKALIEGGGAFGEGGHGDKP